MWQEHDRVLDEVPDCARPLLAPRVAALEARLAPGCTVLTWASMNIDGYLHYARQVPLVLLHVLLVVGSQVPFCDCRSVQPGPPCFTVPHTHLQPYVLPELVVQR